MVHIPNKNKKVISEINVTPFVDVLLVILIIFMVTAPMLNTGFDINLPKSPNALSNAEQPVKVTFSLDKKLNLYFDKEVIKFAEIKNALGTYNKENTQIFIRADKDVKYQEVINLMNVINSSGFNNISLIAEPNS
ncbi:protein TolR [Candidatus Hepatincolaceae symbiont of Richtersius coronifer]